MEVPFFSGHPIIHEFDVGRLGLGCGDLNPDLRVEDQSDNRSRAGEEMLQGFGQLGQAHTSL